MTWNINSVRLRLPLLLRLIKTEQPDVICLQETKCPDDLFPREAITQLGYHLHIHGMKGYNGVAILSRVPIKDPQIYTRAGKQDCRHIAGNVGGMTIHNLYIPAGGDIPDTMINDKFAHKLQVVDELARFFKRTHGPQDRVMACGDFNIAPHEHDVWSHRQLIDVVSHTPIEVEKLARMQKSLSWIDVARHVVPMDQKCYTWWSYRNQDWRKSNRGRRLDHVWITPTLVKSLHRHHVLTEARDWPQPSDHVPVVVEIN